MAVTTSNRLQVTQVAEVTLGTTPNTPRMRTKLVTAGGLQYAPQFTDSAELRADRMTSDSIQVGLTSGGSLPWEFHYPVPNSPEDIDIQSAFYNTWTNTPNRDNDGTADSVITDAGTTPNTVAVTTGPAFVIGQLVRTTGFTNSGNNTISRVTTGGTTSFVASGTTFTAETAPPGTARAKVVGFAGTSGDIAAAAGGLTSTTLDFTTLGLVAGMWIKIGGTAAGDRFATAALNSYARITAIAAHALTLDNLPTGWTTDAGTGKTIKVWYPDYIINGTTQSSSSIERGYLGQGTPTYILQPGMVVNQYSMSITAKQIITGTCTYVGMSGTQSTSSVDASPDAPPPVATYPQFAGSVNVGRVSENGSRLTTPNFCTAFDFTINNNIGVVESIDALGPQDMVGQECTVTGNATTIFGDNGILTRFFTGAATNLAIVVTKGVQAVVVAVPRAIYTGGGPNDPGKNQITTAQFAWKASKDETVTNAQITMCRFEYVEA